jgi:hypothetical protein
VAAVAGGKEKEKAMNQNDKNDRSDPISGVVTSAPAIDRTRPEGAYVSSSVYVGAAQLILIERVNGDCSVSSIEVTRDEAKVIVERMQQLLESAPRGRYDG